jgi:hypothetical protein
METISVSVSIDADPHQLTDSSLRAMRWSNPTFSIVFRDAAKRQMAPRNDDRV